MLHRIKWPAKTVERVYRLSAEDPCYVPGRNCACIQVSIHRTLRLTTTGIGNDFKLLPVHFLGSLLFLVPHHLLLACARVSCCMGPNLRLESGRIGRAGHVDEFKAPLCSRLGFGYALNELHAELCVFLIERDVAREQGIWMSGTQYLPTSLYAYCLVTGNANEKRYAPGKHTPWDINRERKASIY